MKKLFLLSILLFVIMLIPSCSKKENHIINEVHQSPAHVTKELKEISEENNITEVNWLQVGNYWKSQMTAGENSIERTDNVIGTADIDKKKCFVVTSTLTVDSGDTKVEKPAETNYYNVTKDSLETNIKILGSGDGKIVYYPPQTILKFPLKKGKSWVWKGTVNKIFSGMVTYTVNGMEEVEVPAGKFKAVKITAKADFAGPDGNNHQSDTIFWLVKDIGMVKTETSNQLYLDRKEQTYSEMKAYKIKGNKVK